MRLIIIRHLLLQLDEIHLEVAQIKRQRGALLGLQRECPVEVSRPHVKAAVLVRHLHGVIGHLGLR